MEKGEQPAFASPGTYNPNNGNHNGDQQFGLTKREYFAIHIATGLSVQAIAGRHNLAENMVKEVPAVAVLIADALLEELNKTK
jgi:DNA-binding NarL/FixJ family response regulator